MPQVEPHMGFVKIDFIIIKCLLKQMPPPFHTAGDQGGRGGSVRQSPATAKGTCRDTHPARVGNGVVEVREKSPLTPLGAGNV